MVSSVASEADRLMRDIQAEMKRHGLDIATVAARVGVHRTTVADWLQGTLTPSVDHLVLLAAAVALRVVIEDPSSDEPSLGVYPEPADVADEISRLMVALRVRRLACGRTQSSVAASLGVAEETVNRCELGSRVTSLALLLAWARGLGCLVWLRPASAQVEPEPAQTQPVPSQGPRQGPRSTAVRRARAGIETWSGRDAQVASG